MGQEIMKRILLAEDDEIMRITLKDRLAKHNWKVDAVSDGKDAVELLATGAYQLVISDIRMPKLDGWEVLKFVRQSCPATSIVLMTSYNPEDDPLKAKREGAADFICKPFDIDDLIGRVRRILDQKNRLAS